MASFSNDDPDAHERMRGMFGPGQIDQMVRQGLQMCWMMLPKDEQNAANVETHFRRIVERALKDLRDDADAFRSD